MKTKIIKTPVGIFDEKEETFTRTDIGECPNSKGTVIDRYTLQNDTHTFDCISVQFRDFADGFVVKTTKKK